MHGSPSYFPPARNIPALMPSSFVPLGGLLPIRGAAAPLVLGRFKGVFPKRGKIEIPPLWRIFGSFLYEQKGTSPLRPAGRRSSRFFLSRFACSRRGQKGIAPRLAAQACGPALLAVCASPSAAAHDGSTLLSCHASRPPRRGHCSPLREKCRAAFGAACFFVCAVHCAAAPGRSALLLCFPSVH